MTGLFLTKPMSVWTPYGLLMLGLLAVAIIVMAIMSADCGRRYLYSRKVSWRNNAVYWMLGGLICLLMSLFIMFRRGWMMGAAFIIVIGLTYRTVGGGIRSQAERE